MIQNAKLVQLKACGDSRGKLLPLECGRGFVPFDVKRVYYMYDVPDGESRGKHAHIDLRQILICTSGAVTVSCDYGNGRPVETYRLDKPDLGLIIEGLVWRVMTDWAPGTVLMVLADEHFDVAGPKEIRDYNEFLKKVSES